MVQLCTALMGMLADSSKTLILFMLPGVLRSFKKPDVATSRANIGELQWVLRNSLAFKVHEICSLQAGWPYQNIRMYHKKLLDYL